MCMAIYDMIRYLFWQAFNIQSPLLIYLSLLPTQNPSMQCFLLPGSAIMPSSLFLCKMVVTSVVNLIYDNLVSDLTTFHASIASASIYPCCRQFCCCNLNQAPNLNRKQRNQRQHRQMDNKNDANVLEDLMPCNHELRSLLEDLILCNHEPHSLRGKTTM